MPLTTYTAGEVLTASSLNANLSFAANNSGLRLITAQTIGSAVGSVAVSNCFSSTYDAYKIVVTGGAGSNTSEYFKFTLGASTTGYYYIYIYNTYANGTSGNGASNQASMNFFGLVDTNGLNANIEIQNPFAAKYTFMQTPHIPTNIGGTPSGVHQVATSYTGFTLTPSGGTITGGTVRVYGYANS